MFSTCVEVVEGRRKANPALDTTKILNELLANDKWLEQVQILSSELILELGYPLDAIFCLNYSNSNLDQQIGGIIQRRSKVSN